MREPGRRFVPDALLGRGNLERAGCELHRNDICKADDALELLIVCIGPARLHKANRKWLESGETARDRLLSLHVAVQAHERYPKIYSDRCSPQLQV